MERASEQSMVSTADIGVALPQDVVEEILLRVPARQLCRFRAVCRTWRSLLCGSSFGKAHAALRPALILALAADGDRIDVVDLSGNVVKKIQVPAVEEEAVLPTHPGPCFLFRANKRVCMVDPDIGAVFTLPFDDLDNPTPHRSSYWSTTGADYVLGMDTSTGNHKVLRVVTRVMCRSLPFQQLYHVLTLGGGVGGDKQQRQRWRQCSGPQFFVKSKVEFPGVAIQGPVYYLADHFFSTLVDTISHRTIDKNMKSVVSFDLAKEQWTTFQVPAEINTGSGICWVELAKLSNNLAMVHCRLHHSSIDMWFSQDLERGLWVKKHCIDQELLAPSPQMSPEREFTISVPKKVKLLMELDDGRIIFSYFMAWTQEGPCWRTRVYDPRTKARTDLPQLDLCGIVGVYKESLLYLVNE